jgi:hypothetical protein
MANAWTKFVTDHYRKMKKTNSKYQFRNALTDAATLYKQPASVNGGVLSKTGKRRSTMAKKGTRKNRK